MTEEPDGLPDAATAQTLGPLTYSGGPALSGSNAPSSNTTAVTPLRASRSRQIACLVAILLAPACGPTHTEVSQEFLAANPGVTIVDVGVGEGDGSTAYMQIRFKRSDRNDICNVEWGYQHTQGQWRLFHKGKPTC